MVKINKEDSMKKNKKNKKKRLPKYGIPEKELQKMLLTWGPDTTENKH